MGISRTSVAELFNVSTSRVDQMIRSGTLRKETPGTVSIGTFKAEAIRRGFSSDVVRKTIEKAAADDPQTQDTPNRETVLLKLANEYNKLRTEHDALQTENRKLRALLAKTNNQLVDANKRAERLEADLQEAQNQVSQLNDELDQATQKPTPTSQYTQEEIEALKDTALFDLAG